MGTEKKVSYKSQSELLEKLNRNQFQCKRGNYWIQDLTSDTISIYILKIILYLWVTTIILQNKDPITIVTGSSEDPKP
jgi:hypothetical protein